VPKSERGSALDSRLRLEELRSTTHLKWEATRAEPDAEGGKIREGINGTFPVSKQTRAPEEIRKDRFEDGPESLKIPRKEQHGAKRTGGVGHKNDSMLHITEGWERPRNPPAEEGRTYIISERRSPDNGEKAGFWQAL